MRKLVVVAGLILSCFFAYASDTLVVHNNESKLITGPFFTQLEDPYGDKSFAQVYNSPAFHRDKLPFIKYADSVVWVKFVLRNKTAQPYLPVSISNGVLDAFDMYLISSSGHTIHLGSTNPLNKSINHKIISRIINIPILPDSLRTVYLRIKSNDSMAIPIRVQSADIFTKNTLGDNLTLGFFMGMIIVMILYNLMLFFIVGDRSYLYYVFYIIFLGLMQLTSRWSGTIYLPVSKQAMNEYIIPLSRMFFWYAILLFVYEFLQLKQNLLKRYNRYYYGLYVLITVPFFTLLAGQSNITYILVSIAAVVNSLALLIIGFTLYIKGFKPAKFFMLGWSLFLTSVLLTIARTKGLIPYNGFTVNVILYSSTFELVLFSVALADRINFYRKQKDEAQEVALTIAVENERLITEQNFLLENKVKERTQELIETNKSLSYTIENLKSAQTQLIETEKMASLGQLTAGIAHEINNPINFVSANIKPLRLDFEEVFKLIDYYRELENDPSNIELRQKTADYSKQIDIDFIKTEILTLLEGIDEGAGRTTEIVHSLRTFSRTDELILKPADINRSILNTLVLLRSTIPYGIEIKPLLDKLPLLNCYPGKINQVFVNLINNSIQAIKAKQVHDNEYILITTRDYPDNIVIEITDSGIGMTEEVKQHIFDPFFTTKDIGEGTGLGLSIVFGIIEQHHGAIEVSSKPNEGARFTIMLPKTLQ